MKGVRSTDVFTEADNGRAVVVVRTEAGEVKCVDARELAQEIGIPDEYYGGWLAGHYMLGLVFEYEHKVVLH